MRIRTAAIGLAVFTALVAGAVSGATGPSQAETGPGSGTASSGRSRSGQPVVAEPTVAPCPPSPPVATFGHTAEGVVPVQIPCSCPSQPLGPLSPPPIVPDPMGAFEAAVRFLGWEHAELRAVYRIGDTANAFGRVFAFSLGTFCGPTVLNDSVGVELWDPTVGQAGYYAAVVVGQFPAGWSVWGSYRGGSRPP